LSSSQQPIIFIVDINDIVNSVLAGTFWLKGFKPFKFTERKECLKKFGEIDGKVDAIVIVDDQTALDNDLMLIVNIKRINSNAKVLVISEQKEEKYKIKIYEYGADDIALVPLSPIDISDKILLMISKHKLLEDQNDLV
jgi:DNA-binding response OmpR family regulator